MNEPSDRDEPTQVERELLAYVEQLRAHPPQADEQLVATIVRSARWQALTRPYLDLVGTLAGAFALGARVLMDSPRRR